MKGWFWSAGCVHWYRAYVHSPDCCATVYDLQALIQALGGPLLSHSVHVPSIDMSDDEYLVPDTGTLMDMYGNRGLDFIVEVGERKTKPTSVSTALADGGGGGGMGGKH